jgi:hypothetical protein
MINIDPDFEEYFTVKEFVPQSIYRQYGDKSIFFLDARMLNVATAYRKYFNKPIIINNWHTGGTFQQRGYRLPNSTTGAALSQHKFGRAFDCNVKGLKDKDAYDEIVKNYDFFKEVGLSTLENFNFTGSWIHSDVRLTNSSNILIVDP